jgi:hypothetical protein
LQLGKGNNQIYAFEAWIPKSVLACAASARAWAFAKPILFFHNGFAALAGAIIKSMLV